MFIVISVGAQLPQEAAERWSVKPGLIRLSVRSAEQSPGIQLSITCFLGLNSNKQGDGLATPSTINYFNNKNAAFMKKMASCKVEVGGKLSGAQLRFTSRRLQRLKRLAVVKKQKID